MAFWLPDSIVDIIQLFSLLHTRKVSADAVWPLKCLLEDAVLLTSSMLVSSKEILEGNLCQIMVLGA